MPHEIKHSIKEYIEHLKLINRSQETIKQYKWHLKQFIQFIDDYHLSSIHDVQAEHIQDYQKYRHYYENKYKKQDSVRVQNRHLACLKQFFKHLKKENIIMSDPTQKTEYAKEPQTLPGSVLNNAEIKKILKQPDLNTLIGYRDRTILEVLYSTGIRRNELLHLKLQDIDYEHGYLRVNQGKGAKDRVVPLGKHACNYLENYIKGVRPFVHQSKVTEVLFLSKRGKQLSHETLRYLIEKYVKLAGLEKHVTTHTFRRSCATEMIKNKANLMHVKDILGHESMETVKTYCNLTILDLKKAHQKHHPRENEK